MDSSPLNRLPAELRNEIYELALTEPYGIVLDVNNHPAAAKYVYPKTIDTKTILRCPRPAISLLSTCKQIRDEARSIYFSVNKLVLFFCYRTATDRAYEWITHLTKWMEAVGPAQAAQLRRVEFDVGLVPPCDLNLLTRGGDGLRRASDLFHAEAETDVVILIELRCDLRGARLRIPVGRPGEARERIKDQVRALTKEMEPSAYSGIRHLLTSLAEELEDLITSMPERR